MGPRCRSNFIVLFGHGHVLETPFMAPADGRVSFGTSKAARCQAWASPEVGFPSPFWPWGPGVTAGEMMHQGMLEADEAGGPLMGQYANRLMTGSRL